MRTVTLPAAAGAFSLRVSSELMENHAVGDVLAVKPGMRAVRDASGHAMLFWIDHASLRVALRSTASPTGWRACDLAPGLGAVHAFDVAQLADDRLVLVVVAGPTRRLFVTAALSNDPGAAHWDDMERRFAAREELRGGKVLESIRIGAGTTNALPIAIAAVRDGETTEQYLVNIDANDTKWTWDLFELPNNVIGAVELAAGVVHGDRGAFALYATSAGQSLEFTTLPDPLYHRSERYAFPLVGRARCLAVLPSATEGETDIYVAGDGVFVYPAAAEAAIAIAPQGLALAVHELAVTQDAARVALFATAGDQRLLHAEGPRADATGWEQPRQILSGIASAAVVRGAEANELFAAIDGKPTLLYQDPGTKLWKATEIQLPGLATRTMETYSTRIEVSHADGRRAVGQTFELRAGSRTQLFVNGATHLAGPDHAVPVTVDAMGAISIVIPVEDLATPVLRVRTIGGADVEIRPSWDLEQRLAAVTDFGAATLRDGSNEKVVTREVTAGTLGATREAVSAIIQATTSSPGLLRRAAGERIHVLAFSGGEVKLSIQGDHALRATADTWTPDWAKAVAVAAGNALAWMRETIDEAARFAWRQIDELVEFLVEVGTEIVKFTIKGIEAGLRAVAWVLEKGLGIDLSRMRRWLGFVFDWPEIDRVRAQLTTSMRRDLGRVGGLLPTLAAEVDALITSLHESLPVPDPKLLPRRTADLEASARERDAKDPKVVAAQSSPATNWAFTHLLQSVTSIGGASMPELAGVEHVVTELLALWDRFEGERAVVLADLAALLTGETDLATAVQKLTADAVFTVVEILRWFVAKGIAFLEGAFAAFVTLLDTPIPFPLVRGVVGKDLSALELAAFIIAAPASIAHRMVMERPLLPAAPVAGRMLRAVEVPSYVADWFFVTASVGYDVLTAAAVVMEAMPVSLELVRYACNAVRLSAAYPAATSAASRLAWWTYVTCGGVDLIAWLGLKYAESRPKPYEGGIDRLRRFRGALTIGGACVAFFFESASSIEEFHTDPKGYAHTDASLRIEQSVSYWISDFCAGTLAFENPLRPMFVFAGATFGALAAGINVTRIVLNSNVSRAHRNL